MSDDNLLKQAINEEYEQEHYIFYSSEEADDMEEIKPSPEFQQKLDKLLKRERWKRKFRRLGQNIASFIIVVIGSFSLLCTLDQDVRATCFQWIKTTVNGGMTDYQSVTPDNKSSNKDNEPVAGFSLEYIPEGYVLKSADMGEDIGIVTYCNSSKQLIFQYNTTKDTTTSIDNEKSTLSHIELSNGTVCDLYESNTNESNKRLIWQKENYICTLYVTEFEENELIQIVEGIKIKDS